MALSTTTKSCSGSCVVAGSLSLAWEAGDQLQYAICPTHPKGVGNRPLVLEIRDVLIFLSDDHFGEAASRMDWSGWRRQKKQRVSSERRALVFR